jgi:hypothetical protein
MPLQARDTAILSCENIGSCAEAWNLSAKWPELSNHTLGSFQQSCESLIASGFGGFNNLANPKFF